MVPKAIIRGARPQRLPIRVVLAVIGCLASQSCQSQSSPPLALNDVSLLFPPPLTAADKGNLIAIKDVVGADPVDPTKTAPVWSPDEFQNFLAVAGSPAAQVAGTTTQIGLPTAAQVIDAWFIAGIRIDAGAPGLSSDIVAQFGQRPQIRLILQPVTFDASGSPHILDIAAHLIYDFTLPETTPPASPCLLHATPDLGALKAIVADIAGLKAQLAGGKIANTVVQTDGLPLGVYPGLANPATANAVASYLKGFLARHLSSNRLGSMAIIGLPAGQTAPWIFLSMLKHGGAFVPVPGPTLDGAQFAMLFSPSGRPTAAMPVPHTNNLNPITCASNSLPPGLPLSSRKGVATNDLFGATSVPPATAQATIAQIEDPTLSHFFNTDCVSCHTSSRRAIELLHATTIADVAPNALPNGPYDVRNFGWSIDGGVQPSVSGRTAAETKAVVAWLNTNLTAH